MDAFFSMELSCGHTAAWQEAPGSGGGPVVGLPVWCAACEADAKIASCVPKIAELSSTVLSSIVTLENYTHAIALYSTETGEYGYCICTVASGLFSEGDNVFGFASMREAIEDARRCYNEQ